jgi:hypothetical protein
LVFGLAFALGLGDLILSFVQKPVATVKYALIAAAGLVLGGTVIWIRRNALTNAEPTKERGESHGSSGLMARESRDWSC